MGDYGPLSTCARDRAGLEGQFDEDPGIWMVPEAFKDDCRRSSEGPPGPLTYV